MNRLARAALICLFSGLLWWCYLVMSSTQTRGLPQNPTSLSPIPTTASPIPSTPSPVERILVEMSAKIALLGERVKTLEAEAKEQRNHTEKCPEKCSQPVSSVMAVRSNPEEKTTGESMVEGAVPISLHLLDSACPNPRKKKKSNALVCFPVPTIPNYLATEYRNRSRFPELRVPLKKGKLHLPLLGSKSKALSFHSSKGSQYVPATEYMFLRNTPREAAGGQSETIPMWLLLGRYWYLL